MQRLKRSGKGYGLMSDIDIDVEDHCMGGLRMDGMEILGGRGKGKRRRDGCVSCISLMVDLYSAGSYR